MNIAIAIIGYLLAAYLFAAVVVPRIRIRSGYARSWIWSRSGKTKGCYRQPKMGMLTCFGGGIFFAALSTAWVAPDWMMTTVVPLMFFGCILAIIGDIFRSGGSGTGRWKKY